MSRKIRIAATLFILSAGLLSVAQEVDKATIPASGRTDYVPLWLSPHKLGISKIYQTGGNIGIGTTAPTAALDVNGAVNAATSFNVGGTPFLFGGSGPGYDNTAIGSSALFYNTTGNYNTATGTASLYTNNSGSFNTATGVVALHGNTTGSGNTANGHAALFLNSGSFNTAIGEWADELNGRSEERRVGKSVDIGDRRNNRK